MAPRGMIAKRYTSLNWKRGYVPFGFKAYRTKSRINTADLQNILENHKLYKYFKISLQIHIMIVRNQNNG